MTPTRSDKGSGGVSEELRPYVDRSEAAGVDQAAKRLLDAKPQPSVAFRTDLYSRLSNAPDEMPSWRPQRLRRLVFTYAGSGLLLLAFAAIGLAGVGPLGY
jgi:hypothetical protein